MKFSKKQIKEGDTLGQKLRQARQRLGLDLKTIAEYIKVHYKYLRALEEGNYQKLPATVYSKNFLRKYLQALRLPKEEYLQLFLEEKNSYEALNQINKESRFVQKINKKNLLSVPKIIHGGILLVVLLLFFGYLMGEVKEITSPPRLAVQYPAEDLTTNKSSITITGSTEKESQITINEQGVFSNENGYFEKNIELQNGINLIKITAKKKHGKENTIYRAVRLEN